MILVTGASGNAGGSVLKEAVKAKKPVRALFPRSLTRLLKNILQMSS